MADKSSPKKRRNNPVLRGLVDLLGIPSVFLMAPLLQGLITIIGGGIGFIAWYLLSELVSLGFFPTVLQDLVNFVYMPAIAVLLGLAVAYAYGSFLYLDLAGDALYWFYVREELEGGHSWYWRYK